MISEADLFFELHIADLILEVVNEAPEATRSDIQGRAQVVAKQIIQEVAARCTAQPKL